MARLTKALIGVVDGEVYPREFAAGEECPPELEAAAGELGALESADAAAESEKTKPAKADTK